MKIVIFGTGRLFDKNIHRIEGQEIVAAIDNNSRQWGQSRYGIEIMPPVRIQDINYDKIVLMSHRPQTMRNQLITQLGVEPDKIAFYEEFIGSFNKNKLEVYIGESLKYQSKIGLKRILILTSNLRYGGGSLAAVYTSMALKRKGYEVCLATPEGDADFIKETTQKGITVIRYSNLRYASVEELSWMEGFEYIILNTLPMLSCLSSVQSVKKCFLWVHESQETYEMMKEVKPAIFQEQLGNANIYAVSNVAKKNFEMFFKNVNCKLLLCGIPDEHIKIDHEISKKNKLIFAVIGGLSYGKGQKILLDAIAALEQDQSSVEVWMIGAIHISNSYCREIVDRVAEQSNIKLLGELSRKKIIEIYPQIDVVVCSSTEETLSLAIIEGFMNNKICIASDGAGIAEYIDNGSNGFIFRSEDAIDLSQKIHWVIQHRDKLKQMGANGRKTYEKHFTIEHLGVCLETILKQLEMKKENEK